MIQNHSCDPNVIVNGVYINDANFLKPLICLFALKDIPAYTEICFSYYGLDDEDDVVGFPM
jgi:[histone H3]-lysine9 N-trimethyltransferase SUV39H